MQILSTHYLLCVKAAAVCRKIATSCPRLVCWPTTPLGKCGDPA